VVGLVVDDMLLSPRPAYRSARNGNSCESASREIEPTVINGLGPTLSYAVGCARWLNLGRGESGASAKFMAQVSERARGS
jgi:hypothetical protein